MAFNLAFFKNAVADAAAQVRKLRANVAELQAERETVANAPAHRSDLKAIFEAWFEVTAGDFRGTLKCYLANLGRQPEKALGTCRTANIWNRGVAVVGISPVHVPPGAHSMDMVLSALLSGPLREGLFRMIDELADDGEGLPAKERRARLAELDAQIEKLSKQERELVADARSAGITID